jgi:N6-adenosine-specific RNA methylase IME4
LKKHEKERIELRVSNVDTREPESGRTQKELAKDLGWATGKVATADIVWKRAKDEVKEEIKKGNKTFNEVYTEIKKEDRLEKINKQREELNKEVLEQPIGDYDVIVIDPPWEYSRTGSSYDPDGNRAMVPYPEMSMDELKKLKLPIKENCVLWLWTTNAFMKEAYELLKVWGFQDKTILTWNKEFLGAGWWLRNITEHCILAIKGEPRKSGVFKNEKWTTLISEKRTEHSAKPEIFYKMVDEICAGRKLDYFARKKREGWDVFGDEVKQ